MTLLELAKKKILVLDGAMGTAIQALDLPEDAFDGRVGCNEILVLTVPEKIATIHRDYFVAGSDIVETNTFGAAPLVLGEYDLADRTEDINRTAAQIARRVADEISTPDRPRFVSGSIGGGTKLATLGQITYDELYTGLRRQCEGLIDGGVDLLQIETCQDLLQANAAINAARDAMAESRDVLLYVSVTVEQTGTMLTGADIATAITVLEPFAVEILGMNCATGPLAMRPHLEVLAQQWPGLIGVYPNAGLPIPCAEGVCYPETPDEFAAELAHFLDELPINVIGGCCGTTPDHIRKLAAVADGRQPKKRNVERAPSVASLFNSVTVRQNPPPLFIGERANATGSKAFRETIIAGDHEKAFDILTNQEEHGSHAADLSVAYAGQDEIAHMRALVERAGRECRLPLFIDSNNDEAVEAALKLYPGRAVINSINLEDGGKRAAHICPLARRFGAGLICLTIDEEGMAMTAERKIAVAERLVELCTGQYGMRREDLFIDALTFTVGSGDPTLKNAAVETVKAVRLIKERIPDVHAMLGLSNVSFGLSLKSRKVLNSVFLDLCLEAGLDAAILNPRHIVPLAELDNADVEHTLALLQNRTIGKRDPLEAFIEHFAGRTDEAEQEQNEALPPREAVARGIVTGQAQRILDNLDPLLPELGAEGILNDVLVPAMKHVGELFGAGKMQLPFVLKSAAAMKKAVAHIEPHFEKSADDRAAKKLLLATVRGDVHDIGKNLVDIIVGNNGFDVINLGTKIPVDVIIAEAQKHRVDAIGMSGLLVSSALIMGENLRAMSDAGITTPVLVGGAALTTEFVRETLKPAYPDGNVTYCADAFAGLVAMQQIAEGRTPADPESKPAPTLPKDSIAPESFSLKTVTPPEPPFWGSRVLNNINLDSIFSLINEVALFRGRWGYRRGKMGKSEYDELVESQVRPKYNELKRIVKVEKLFAPQAVYGYFHARGEGDAVWVDHEGRELRFDFPRRADQPRLCIADFFRPDGDVAGFFVVTMGNAAATRGREIFEKFDYLDYFLLHGLAVEATDALAEYVHWQMRHELGIGEDKQLNWQGLVMQKYRGSRYGFGYPACPDLAANELVFTLLDPARIGVSLSESHQMTPEVSTSAIVAHHPQAKYFAV